MMENGNIFLLIVDKMRDAGHLSAAEADSLHRHYLDYVSGLVQNNRQPAPPVAPRPYEFKAAPVYSAPPVSAAPTREFVRERNLSWILNIGVILILISGVIFGTTTWGMLGSFGRVALLFCVSLLFFGVSALAGSLFRLSRTSNAFWILGSLMLPVSLLSIGWLRLFGNYFSFFGHGRYLFALMCGLVCLPLFAYSAQKFKNRVFSWLTLIDLSLSFTFFAASFYFKAPVFYLLLLTFSGALIAAKSLFENCAALSLYLRESGLFIQFNLILTSLFAVFSYDAAYLYSINILAAAIFFFLLSLQEGLPGYDYVSALFINVGLFMLARDFHNTGLTYLIVAAAAVLFTCAAAAMNANKNKSRRFNLIGGLTAIAGFVYISFAMLVYGQKSEYMIVGLMALCVILADMIYMSVRTGNPFLGAVVPIGAFVTVYHSVAVIGHYFAFPYDKAYLLAMTVLLFAVFYIFNNNKSLRAARVSGAVVALLNMVILFLTCIQPRPLLISLPIIGIVFTAMLYMIYIKSESGGLKLFLRYCAPLMLTFSLCLLRYAYSIYVVPPLPFYFYSAFICFVLSFAELAPLREFKKPLYYCSQLLMAIFFIIMLPLELAALPRNAVDFTGLNALMFAAVFLLAAGCSIFSLIVASRRAERYVLLHFTLFAATMFVVWLNRLIFINYYADLSRYVLYTAGFITLAAFVLAKDRGIRRQICFYSCALSALLLIGGLFTGSMLWYEYTAAIVYASLLCLELALCGLDILMFLPLLLLINTNRLLCVFLLDGSAFCLLPAVIWTAVLVFTGSVSQKLVFTRKRINWFALAALLNIFTLPYYYSNIDFPHLSVIAPGCLVAAWFFYYRKKLFNAGGRWGSALFTVSLIFPYYSLLSSFELPSYLSFELVLLPVVVLSFIILKWIFAGVKTGLTRTLEYLVPSLCYFIVLCHLVVSDSLIEAVIIISFGILSLLYGSLLKTGSALIMGGAVTLAGTVLKTKVFWLSIQWWVYLLAAGLLLVTFAGVNEYLKNKNTGGLTQRAGKWLERFRE